ncbi:MAG: nucleotidyltransferase domain-containing protein [Gemmatimonadota bacterium]|nr:nucleotidyltransferase domain-containing protein [Gemmatimonadota bacterium]MYA10944.1 nucleotidyltransferase domain-containing protein [Gemmatimonadota bacterium]MYE94707.1 nucleotidyltransferase domain-containing protein [Gemmatimonadota bacterium]
MDGTVDQSVLDRVIRRVVQVAQPEKIILFGSAAQGRMGPHSDLDLLVVRDGVDALDLMGEIYLNLRGVGAAVDAIVASPDDLERYRDSHGMLIREALREGRVVYEAA